MAVHHKTIPAAGLRAGDLIRIGSSTNYVLVAHVEKVSGNVSGVAVTIYNGDQPHDRPTLYYAVTDQVDLSMRNSQP